MTSHPVEIFPKWRPWIRLHFYRQKFSSRWFTMFLQQVFRWHWFGRWRCWIWGLHPKIFVGGHSIRLIRAAMESADCLRSESDSHIVIDMIPGSRYHPLTLALPFDIPRQESKTWCQTCASSQILIIMTKLVGGLYQISGFNSVGPSSLHQALRLA